MPGPKASKKGRRERKEKILAERVEKHIERRGGYRPNAGRKPEGRSIAKRILGIREITEDILRSGKVPLRVMINNMIYYDEQATFLQERVGDALADNAKAFDADKFIKALELINQMGDARMKATQVASMAAPYLHPRLSAMDIQVTRKPPPKDLQDDVQTERFSDDYRQLRSQPYILEQAVVDVESEPEEAE